MADKRVRIGVIGVGTFAEQCHIPGVQTHPEGEVVALCARNHERVREVANRFGVPTVSTDYRELLANPEIDAVTVSLPDNLHFPVVMEALQAGKHVFCEKPLARDAHEARQMAELAQQAGLVAMVSFTFRYSRALPALRELVRSGALGTPFAASLQVHWGRIGYPGSSLEWRDQLAQSSLGIWGDGASHLFDALNFVLGPVERVAAQMEIIQREAGIAQTDNIDHATCLAQLRLPEVLNSEPATAFSDRKPGIVHATLLTSRVSPGPGEFRVIGTRGAATINLTRGVHEWLRLVDHTGKSQDLALPEDAYTGESLALTRMMGAFVEAVARGKLAADDPDFMAGLYTQLALDAALQSARQQSWITLPSVS